MLRFRFQEIFPSCVFPSRSRRSSLVARRSSLVARRSSLVARRSSLVALERIAASAFAIAATTILSATVASAQTLYVTADRTVVGGNPINVSGFTNVTVGRNAVDANFFDVDADVIGGVSESLRVFNDSTVNLNAGRFDGFASSINGTSVLNINQSIINDIDGNEDGRIVLNDGEIDDLVLNDFSVGIINGGFVRSMTLSNRSELTINGGALESLIANTNSEVTVNGGTIQDNIGIQDSSVIDIFAGTFGDDAADRFNVENNARLNFKNGNVSASIRTRNNARTTIEGGNFASTIRGADSTSLTSISGGLFTQLASTGTGGRFILFGTNIVKT